MTGRDAAFATELGYGTLRAAGTLDEIIAACSERPLQSIDAPVRDLLRLGAYQALRTRVPAHAAVATTVDLARATGNARAAGFLNAVMRRIARDDWDSWVDRLSAGGTPLARLARQTAHPEWIAEAFRDALEEPPEGDLVETGAALRADDSRPTTHLVAWPGGLDREDLVRQSGGTPGPWSPYAVRLSGGEPGRLIAVRAGQAAVQDEGSQLCALALANAPIDGRDERWLDLCAGPGGKTALLAALAAQREATSPPTSCVHIGRSSCGRQRRSGACRCGSGMGAIIPKSTVASTGCCSMRRARGSARCAGGRRRDGAAIPPIFPRSRSCNDSCSLPRCDSSGPVESWATSSARRTGRRPSRSLPKSLRPTTSSQTRGLA